MVTTACTHTKRSELKNIKNINKNFWPCTSAQSSLICATDGRIPSKGFASATIFLLGPVVVQTPVYSVCVCVCMCVCACACVSAHEHVHGNLCHAGEQKS